MTSENDPSETPYGLGVCTRQFVISDRRNHKPVLTVAVEKGDEAEVRRLLRARANVNAFGYYLGYGEPPIVTAVRFSRVNLVPLLLSHLANVNLASDRGHTALIRAAYRNHTDTIRLLLLHNANPNVVDNSHLCALYWTVKFQNVAALNELLGYGTDVNVVIQQGASVLHTAASTGNAEIVRILIDHSASVDAADKNGDTPLFNAVRVNSFDVVNTLLEAGASANICNVDYQTPLHIAAASVHNSIDLMQLLLEYDALVNVPDHSNFTPLVLSLRNFIIRPSCSVARCLIQHGSLLNDVYTIDALKWAVLYNGKVDILKFAADAGLRISGMQWVKDYLDSASVESGDQANRESGADRSDASGNSSLFKYLENRTKNAPSLFDLCRAAIREHFIFVACGASTYSKIQKLPLPDLIRFQLLLEDDE